MGRVSVTTPDGPAVLLVNYDVVDDALVFRNASWTRGPIPIHGRGKDARCGC
ncbi:hypothetical protein ACF08O_32280 [Streptomyces paradoxus]|uniref:hypothetical protein n=1 Tax=Streptomyces paradoxus TaxID=66375 RepID=UPI0036FF2C64